MAAGQEAGSAAHWAATDWGVKIESVSQIRVFVQRTGQASLIQNSNNLHNVLLEICKIMSIIVVLM